MNVLLCGATSAVGNALARRLAARGWNLFLAARNADALERVAADLRIRGGGHIVTRVCDVVDGDSLAAAFAEAVNAFADPLDGVIVCHGALLDERNRFLTATEIRQTIDVNFTSAAILLSLAAEYLTSHGQGFLVAISSVAGDRGRQSNYTYGAAKAGLTAYLSGLRNRLYRSGVTVITVKPGMIDTPMTRSLCIRKGPLMTTPERVAFDMEAAILRRRDVIYSPWYWRSVMAVIKAIPETIFKRMRL
jgi:decaprenylphospho-beta-D-erythro-pentofuranosid-2-ulose 2-reductase